jgi:hypothetical protein
MKSVMLFALALLLLTGFAYAKDYEVNKKAGDYTVDVKMDRNPPAQGKNNMDIAITDKSGKAVTDAQVVVEYTMPPMPGMAPMNYKADAELKGDRYKAMMNLSMAGSWNVAVKITREAKSQSAKFTIDVK